MDIKEAQERYQDALDASRRQREQIEEDLAFSDPSDPQQWDPDERAQRTNDPGGARPCLVLDQLSQYVSNVAGQVEQRPPALHALPVDSGADRKVAEQLDGFFRHIEHASRAQQHYARALTSAARAGVGYLIVRPEVIDKALNYQEPRISSEGDPLRVVIDPWSVALDGSDADSGWLLTPFSHRAFERTFGAKAEKVSFGDKEEKVSKDEKEDIIVAEQWLVVNERRKMVVFTNAEGDQASLSENDFKAAKERGEPLQMVREYDDTYRCVKWCRLSGAEILTKETVYPASGIGIVPVYGYIGFADGRMSYCGIPRRARAAQMDYNLHASEFHAYMKLAPRAPWIVSMRAIKGLEPLWDKASAETRAYLPYNDIDPETQQPIAPPVRSQVSTNLQNHMAGMDQALRNIQAAIGMYQANLGAPSNETSGVAIESRKQQGEASTANFPANLAASLTQVGRLVLEMIPRTIDTRRQMRILGIDMTPSSVVVDPKQPQAVMETPQGISINPNLGRYDVRVVVGPSYSTQRTQAQEAYTEMMRANPAMMPAIAPLWAQVVDAPHSDKLAQVLTAMAPPEVRYVLQPEGEKQESTAALTAENEQLKAALAEATQIAEQMQGELAQAEAEQQNKRAEIEVKEDQVAIQAFDAVTKRLQAINAGGGPLTPDVIAQTMQQVLAQSQPQEEPEPMPDPAETIAPMVQGLGQEMQQQIQALAQAQAQQAEALAQLIKLVQAPRERIPEIDPKTDRIKRVLDRIVLEQAEPEGPMQ